MRERRSLFTAGASILNSHKRYIVWFYLLSLLLAICGAVPFSAQIHDALDHTVYAERVLHGFDLAVFIELLARPQTGSLSALSRPSSYSTVVFILLSIIFIPGVLAGYIADVRIPREEFFRACGKHVWRFVRVMLFFLLIAVPTTAILFGIKAALGHAADQASDERLPFFVKLACTLVTFVVLLAIRAWFDLAQTDVVVRNESQIRKSVGRGFRMMRQNAGRLIGAYLAISIVGLLILVLGVLLWSVVPPASVLGAFLVSQLILLLILATRFWQRASAVELYLEQPVEPIHNVEPTPVLVNPVLPDAIVPEGAAG